jgi:hypothetical protein
MRLGLLLLVSLAAACTRPNPAFDGGGDPQDTSTSASGSASLTSGPNDGTVGPVSSTGAPSTGAPSTGDGADSTSVGPTTAGSEGTTGPVVGSTGECELVVVMFAPFADAFMQSGTGQCGGFDCEPLDSGASPQGLIQGATGDFQSYLLMSFDLAEMNPLQAPMNATLTLNVGHDAAMELEVSQVFPTAWTEGDGFGDQPAEPGEAAWNWSSNPTEWTTPMASGTFEMVLGGALPLGGANVPFVVGSHPADIVLDPTAVGDWLEGPDVIHLVVTKVEGEGPAIAFSRDSVVAPRLAIVGC